MTLQSFKSLITNKTLIVDWSKVEEPPKENKRLRIPVIITYQNNDMKLGHVVTSDSLEVWAAKEGNIFRVDVQLGTRPAFDHEETDLF